MKKLIQVIKEIVSVCSCFINSVNDIKIERRANRPGLVLSTSKCRRQNHVSDEERKKRDILFNFGKKEKIK